ncbi:hypothetical protein JL722_7150 [Aureococcus anophagefferens]|nr:hypothetical protein JL722_7150 [Aureococcus anophagefferens]
MAEAAPALSEYEQLRVANILRNAAELKRLGLDGAPPTRRSLRAAKLPAPEYKEPTGSAARAFDAEVDDEGRVAAPGGRRKRAKTEAYAPPANPSSIKNLDVDLDGLRERYLGKIIPPMGGPGTEITWFAQPRQWEGTPVVQRLINCDGGVVEDDETGETSTFEETPVLLFCRDEGQGYVCCGELSYLGHDPDRIPVRFVWKLDDYDLIKGTDEFKSLVANCHSLLQSPV